MFVLERPGRIVGKKFMAIDPRHFETLQTLLEIGSDELVISC